jgi:galactose oxidase-like protein
MKQGRRLTLAVLLMAWLSSPGLEIAWASHTCEGGPAVCGQNSGLVPFHKDAILASLLWAKAKAECPKMLILMRPSEFKPKDYLNPTVGGIFSGFNPKYVERVQGGFGLGQLDRSGWSRYAPDLDRENAQLIDVCGLQALIDAGMFTKKQIADLTDADFSLSGPFFQDAGFSKGLSYNLFCMGQEAGSDGRLYIFGFHDKGGNNGGRKVNIYNPKTEKWVPRVTTCVRSGWEEDPTGTTPPHCSPLDETNTDPLHPSDMKYQRWYPTTVALPDGRILILSGSDTDTSKGPGGNPDPNKIEAFRRPVPEVYDPKTDKTVALENARKLLPMYVRSFVVQTGPGINDWKVAVLAEVDPLRPLPGQPGGPNIGGYDPFFYYGNTYLLDVQAALADPNIDVPGENHWGYVGPARNAHEGAGSAIKVKIHADGTSSQEVYSFGGGNGSGSSSVATVEKINFSHPVPTWYALTDLVLPADQNNPVILPDGKLLVVGGRGAGRNTLHYQMFDTADGSRTDLIESPVPRHDHSTALLMPNGGVWVMGGNRVQLIPGGNENLAAPVAEFYQPPYFFKGPRPVIEKAPHKLSYGKTFNLRVTNGEIGSVAIIRTGPITHNWAWGNRYVGLPFEAEKRGHLDVMAPHRPGLAIAGDYLLFVVSKDGVPSEGKHIRLKLSDEPDEDDDDKGDN